MRIALLLNSRFVCSLTIIDSLCINDRVGVEILVGRAVFGRTAKQFSILHIGTVPYVWLTCIHPPGIHSYCAKLLVELTPEYLTCTLVVGIIESVFVAEPVNKTILDTLLIDIAFLVEFLEIVWLEIIFWPAGNHDLCLVGMNSIDHSLWIRETLAVKLESTPLVIYPIVPIHHDIVDWKVALAETCQCVKYL